MGRRSTQPMIERLAGAFRPLPELERELELARQHGRWLSDDERSNLELQRLQRHKLMAFLVVCLIVPPLWPLALALSLYLLFPATTARLALGLGVGAALFALMGTVLLITLLAGLLMALF